MGRQRMEKEVGKTATDEEIAYERHQIPLLPLSLKHTDNNPQEFIPTDAAHRAGRCPSRFLRKYCEELLLKRAHSFLSWNMSSERDSKRPLGTTPVQQDIIQAGHQVVSSIIQDFTDTEVAF